MDSIELRPPVATHTFSSAIFEIVYKFYIFEASTIQPPQ